MAETVALASIVAKIHVEVSDHLIVVNHKLQILGKHGQKTGKCT